jgi:hypothetical protein
MENKETIILLEEIIKLLSVQVKRGVPQTTLIKELDEVGFQPKRIAELLGTTANTVRVAIHHNKKSSNKK